MKMITHIGRFKASNALPYGTSQSEQDPLFWDGLDVFEVTTAEIAERAREEAKRG